MTPTLNGPFYFATVNTLKASRWELFCAKLFGRRRFHSDGIYTMKAAHYNGKVYFLDYS